MFARRAVFALLLFAATVAAAPPLPAPLDPEMKTAYTWRVVLKIDPHPALGPAVKKQLLADLKAALGPALGDDFGTVEFVDLAEAKKEKWEPLWKRFDEKGWAALEGDSLKEFQVLTGVKTHFLTLTAGDGKFTLQSRQHDGSTGLVSPQVRRCVVTDADKLSRTAGLMLAADFGPVCTAEPLPGEKDVCLIRLRGGELPGADRWLKVGDVYQYALILDVPRPQPRDEKPKATKPGQVVVVPSDRKAQAWAYTLLRVTEVIQPGVAKCDILTRNEPFPRARQVVGYRGMKVSTREAAVSVRIEDKDGKPPPPSAPLQVWATEFGPRAKPNDRDLLDRRGDLFTSGKTLRGVAVVSVKLGAEHQLFPLPVLDHGDPPRLLFGFDEGAVRKAKYEDAAVRFYNKVLDARLAQEELVKALRLLIDKQENKAALKRTADALKGLDEDDARLTQELKELRESPDAKDPIPAGTLATAERLLAGLRLAKPELQQRVSDLEVAIAKADNPAEYEKTFRANEITRQIAFHERRGEIPQALEKYDELIELTQLEEARKRKKKLEDEWTPKGDEHAALRQHLTDNWGKATSREEFDAAIPVLREKVLALAKLDDRLGLRLAVTVIEGGYVRLGDLLNGLDAELSQDRDEILKVKRTMEALRKVEELTRDELKRVDVPPKPDEKKPEEKK